MAPTHNRRKHGIQYRTGYREENSNDQYQIHRDGDHKNEYKCKLRHFSIRTQHSIDGRRAFGTA